MDKAEQYKSIVRDIVGYIANLTPDDEFSETQTIMDDIRQCFLPIFGFQVFQVELHRICIQHDGTDLVIACSRLVVMHCTA